MSPLVLAYWLERADGCRSERMLLSDATVNGIDHKRRRPSVQWRIGTGTIVLLPARTPVASTRHLAGRGE